MTRFDDLTLVIPTHFRHGYLKRLLDYFRDSGLRTLVADSSDDPFNQADEYADLQYHHYPKVGLPQKVSDVLSKVTTPYTVMCADDDFITLSGLQTCLAFLRDNPDYAAAQGHIIQFRPEQSDIEYSPMYLHAVERDVDGATAAQRVKQHFANNVAIYYAIRRTETYLDGYREAVDNGLSNVNFFPKLDAMLTVIHGKHKVLPVFYSAREFIPGSGSSTTRKFSEFIDDPEFAKEIEAFRDVSSRYIAEKDHITYDQARGHVDETVELMRAWYNRRAPRLANSALAGGALHKVARKISIKVDQLKRRKEIRESLNKAGFPYHDDAGRSELERIESFIRSYDVSHSSK